MLCDPASSRDRTPPPTTSPPTAMERNPVVSPLPLHPIYLDYNATTPVDPVVTQALVSCFQDGRLFGNPSSAHAFGQTARALVTDARKHVAEALGSKDDHSVIFTSGATESLNLALKGTISKAKQNFPNERLSVILSPLEHAASHAVAEELQTWPCVEVHYLDVDCYGRVKKESLRHLLLTLDSKVVLVSCIHANAEIGTIQPIEELVKVTKEASAITLFHTDASQSFGKIPVDVEKLQVDFLTIAGHKIYAPKGVGCLYVRNRATLAAQQTGGGQEFGLRGGTENVPYIVALSVAAELARVPEPKNKNPTANTPVNYASHMRQMCDLLRKELLARAKENGVDHLLVIHGPQEAPSRLPNTLSVGFRGIEGRAIVHSLQDTVAISTGSACHSNADSTVSSCAYRAVCGTDAALLRGTIRMSTGRFSDTKTVLEAASLIIQAVHTLYTTKA